MGKDDNRGKGSFRKKSTVNCRGVQTFGKISTIEAVNSGNNGKETICSWQSARSKYMLCVLQSLGRVNICSLKVFKKNSKWQTRRERRRPLFDASRCCEYSKKSVIPLCDTVGKHSNRELTFVILS